MLLQIPACDKAVLRHSEKKERNISPQSHAHDCPQVHFYHPLV